MTTIEARVRRGALLLDRKMPGWAAEINQEELNLAKCDDCVLGQVYGNYGRGSRTLGLWDDDDEPDFGFDSAEWSGSDWEMIAEYAALAAAWRVEIQVRLAVPDVPAWAVGNCPAMVEMMP